MAEQALSLSYGQAFVAPERRRHRSSMSVLAPEGEILQNKGVSALISDSIWRNAIAKQAGDLSVRGFLSDYYSTPAHWDVKTSATRVLRALNSWSHSQSSYIEGGSYVSSMSLMILRGCDAHLFHMGDTLVFRLRGAEFEQLTRDHVTDLGGYRYPSRALGLDGNLDIDYTQLPLKQGDLFLFTTRAVRGTLMPSDFVQLIRADVSNLDAACERLAEAAQARAGERGYGAEQFCFQLVRIDRLPEAEPDSAEAHDSNLPVPAELTVGERLDGLEVLEVLSRNAHSRVYRVRDERSRAVMVLRAPSPELSSRNAYLEHFLLQQWVAERVNSPFIAKLIELPRPRRHLYYLMADVRGESLSDWVQHHPQASMGQRLDIARQLAKAVQALHRRDVLHQQVHPDTILIDPHGQVVLRDFSACFRRDGESEEARELAREVGLSVHSAPEYALGDEVGRRSDQYALASTLYWLLTGDVPYDQPPDALRSHTGLEQMRYRSARTRNPAVPAELDDALCRALDPQRALRFRRLSEFLLALRDPRKRSEGERAASKAPTSLWQGIAGLLMLLLVLSWLLK